MRLFWDRGEVDGDVIGVGIECVFKIEIIGKNLVFYLLILSSVFHY